MVIKSIHIKNFRSIINEKIALNEIAVFVGNNDVGKSNYLKALNLFFNNETDFNVPFNFNRDFSLNAKTSYKMAKEIVITLEIIPPSTYKGNKNIIWSKVWRASGLLPDKEKRVFKDKSSIELGRSRIKYWMDHLKFRYVPAVKSDHYFQELLGDLHDTLADSIEKEISNAAVSFTNKIQESTNEITKELDHRLGLKSILQLPQDLRAIFQTLDFNTKFEDINLSLSNRGDGIKSRHIPVLLKFLSEQDNKTRNQGAPRIDTIWGFEEPENNLELSKAFELARDFYEYSKDIQILITTHSSAFYGIKRINNIFKNIRNFSEKSIAVFFIEKDENDNFSSKAIEVSDDLSGININLGLLPVITPYINEKVNEISELKKNIEEIQSKFQNIDTPIIILEGLSDKCILEEAINIFSPTLLKCLKENELNIISDHNAGINWVSDFVKAWFYLRKDKKVIVLFDDDEAGNIAKKDILSDPKCKRMNQEKKLRILKYETPPHLYEIKKKAIDLPITLEEMYSFEIWQYAQTEGYLEERKELSSLLKDFSLFYSIENHLKENLSLSPEQMIYCLYKVKNIKKEKVSKYVKALELEKKKKVLSSLKKVVEKICTVLCE